MKFSGMLTVGESREVCLAGLLASINIKNEIGDMLKIMM